MTCRLNTEPHQHWLMCSRGTVGCPHVHDGRTPHCIECAAGEPCRFAHDPPCLEMDVEEFVAQDPQGRAYLLKEPRQ